MKKLKLFENVKKYILSVIFIGICVWILISINANQTYTIIFKNYDGTILEVQEVKKGDLPVCSFIPNRENDSEYTYIFVSWDKEVVKANKDEAYSAVYDKELIKKDINVANNENIIEVERDDIFYTITFIDYDGKVLYSYKIKHGMMPSFVPPNKIIGDYEYIFNTWEPSLHSASASQTYKATYTVFKLNNDSNNLPAPSPVPTFVVDFNVQGIGETPSSQTISINSKVIKPNNPKQTGYVFVEWCSDSGCTSPWDFDNDVITTDTTLFAKWEYKAGIYIDGLLQRELTLSEVGHYAQNTKTYITDPNSDLILPDGVYFIDAEAFKGCNNMKTIVIPDGVSSISHDAFRSCISLTSVTIPDSVLSIGSNAFAECSSLASIIIPEGVNTIEGYSFYQCESLNSISIPNTVTSIGQSAFRSCISLTSLTIPDSVINIGADAFSGCSSLILINIPVGLQTIKMQAFFGCTSLTSITIPNTVTSIESNAFCSCTSLTSLVIPDSVLSIGGGAFAHTSLSSFAIPNSVSSIEDSTFAECHFLTSITIPNSITAIGNSAFSGCRTLTSINIPSSVLSIGSNAFRNCHSLESITIPNGVTEINDETFFSCIALTSVSIPNTVTSIGKSAFFGCHNITSIDIPNNVTNIKEAAFKFCSLLTSINVSNGLQVIGKEAFAWCNSLSSINIPNSVYEIGEDAFYNIAHIYYSGTATGSPWGALQLN